MTSRKVRGLYGPLNADDARALWDNVLDPLIVDVVVENHQRFDSTIITDDDAYWAAVGELLPLVNERMRPHGWRLQETSLGYVVVEVHDSKPPV